MGGANLRSYFIIDFKVTKTKTSKIQFHQKYWQQGQFKKCDNNKKKLFWEKMQSMSDLN